MEIKQKIKTDIESAIKDFNQGPLFDKGIYLFNVLGYNTQRQNRLHRPVFEEFRDNYLDGNPNIPDMGKFLEKAKPEDWETVELLFQITKDEMKGVEGGRIDDAIIESFLFLAIELRKPQYNRTELAQITRQVNRAFPMPALILFKYGGQLTLSVIKRRLHKKDAGRDVLEKVTLVKDININNPHRAHVEILYDLGLETLKTKQTIANFIQLQNAWRKTLDSSELNKHFYGELANWYHWAMQNVKFPDGEEKNAEIRNATAIIRLLTRLIFIWFIKEKGLIPPRLFNEEKLREILNSLDGNQSAFYKAILQNLFFATLNQEQGKRAVRKDGQHYNVTTLYRYKALFRIGEPEILALFKDIPFLNGGLFECLDKPHPTKKTAQGNEEVVRVDGFSDRDDNVLKVPDFLFFGEERDIDLNEIFDTQNKKYRSKGLIKILEQYKFTITENTPIEEEIALDPELLGKVFENLLASFNPETQTTARKRTGSFYTPREIVDYMADESLKAALAGLVARKLDNATEEDIKTGLDILFAYTEETHAFSDDEVSKIIEAVSEIKILDPACGSGAFPMGILHKLVFILNKLDKKNKIWRELQKQKALMETEKAYSMGEKEERRQRLDEIAEAFDLNTSDYGRKLYLIENSIYGVDIQPIAAQISRLRFFISLIVEQNMDKAKENLGVIPLPNLETKFVAADTLVGITKPDQMSFGGKQIESLEHELLVVRHKHFNARTPKTKRKYREEDKKIRHEIADTLKSNSWPPDIAEMLARWDPYAQNHCARFFDMEWMFGIRDGFDIVIGNPPYVQIQKFSGRQEQKDWESQKYEAYAKTGDIYCLFYEKGNNLLKTGGVLAHISSNKWMRANYGKKIRYYFAKHTNPLILIDFGGFKVFESATVDTNILIFSNTENKKTTHACSIGKNFSNNTNISEYIEANAIILKDLNEDSWIISSKKEYAVKKRIEDVGTPLKDWDISINYGIKTGFNEAFIIDGKKKNELIAADPKNAEIIKPVLRGRDIKRYKTEFANLWLINPHNGYQDTKPIDINEYPLIRKHLDRYWEKLLERKDKGTTPYNLRNCAYFNDFKKEKIAWGNLALSAQFSLANKGSYINAPSPMITPGNKYILSVLNSSVGDHYIRSCGVTRNGGYFEYKPMFVEKLPIPKISIAAQKPFEILVDCILYAKAEGLEKEASTLDSVVDGLVYDLYFVEEMKKANCYITVRISEVVKPFRDDDTNEFKTEYVKKLYQFCNEDKTVYRGLTFRRTVDVVKIVTGEKRK